jgi:hypothetical protein
MSAQMSGLLESRHGWAIHARCPRRPRMKISICQMGPLDLIKLTALMDRSSGSPEVTIGLIDGPVAIQHPAPAGYNSAAEHRHAVCAANR